MEAAEEMAKWHFKNVNVSEVEHKIVNENTQFSIRNGTPCPLSAWRKGVTFASRLSSVG